MTSSYYPTVKDHAGFENNIFDPKRLKWKNLHIHRKVIINNFPHLFIDDVEQHQGYEETFTKKVDNMFDHFEDLQTIDS